MEKHNHSTLLIVIVAIVAIVAIVILVQNNNQYSKSISEESTYNVYDEEGNLIGEGIRLSLNQNIQVQFPAGQQQMLIDHHSDISSTWSSDHKVEESFILSYRITAMPHDKKVTSLWKK